MELSEMFDNVYGVLQGADISVSLVKLYVMICASILAAKRS